MVYLHYFSIIKSFKTTESGERPRLGPLTVVKRRDSSQQKRGPSPSACPQRERVFVLKLFTFTGMNGVRVVHLDTADVGRSNAV